MALSPLLECQLTSTARFLIAVLQSTTSIPCAYSKHICDLDISSHPSYFDLATRASSETDSGAYTVQEQVPHGLSRRKGQAATTTTARAEYTFESDLHSHILYRRQRLYRFANRPSRCPAAELWKACAECGPFARV
jgi:hypothetical protein